jgi:DNA-binding transcriptional LysR family regulator
MRLDVLLAFRAVAELGSFTAAARRLGLDKSKVSRDVRDLERHMGTPLFARSTRSVRLTAEGRTLLAELGPHLLGIDLALLRSRDDRAEPVGEVTLTTTADLGRELIAPALVRFRARFPGVRVRLLLTPQVVDLLGDGVDLALRVGRPGGGSLVARKVGQVEAGFFASPSYLRRAGTPARPEELARHECLWPRPARGQRVFMDQPPPPQVACDDFALLAELARAGGGVALLPTFVAARDEATGALCRVLPSVRLLDAPAYLVSRPERPLPARVAALRTFLLEARLFGA